MTNLTLPEEESEFEEKSKSYDNLGPNYFAAQAMSERFMSKFKTEYFEPLIEEFTDKFRDKLWSDLQISLLSDTESNLQSEMWHRIDRTIDELIGGNKDYMRNYVLGKYGDTEIRKAIAQHIPKELQDARIEDLEKELEQARKDLKYYRELRNY